jgi:hypothetical protein
VFTDAKTGKLLEGSNWREDEIKNEVTGRNELRLWEGDTLVKTLVKENGKLIAN